MTPKLQQTVVIYLDILLFVNTVVNFTILYITYKILGMKVSKPRIIFATALSSFYGLVVCLPQMSVFLNIFFKAAAAVITTLIAFDFKNIKILIKNVIVFLLVTFGYIGIITSFQYLPFASSAFYIQNGEIYYNLPLPYILSATIVLFLAEHIISRHFSKKIKRGDIVECKLLLNGKSAEFKAFCDSGNFLREPISGLPVVLVNAKVIFSLLFKEPPQESELNLLKISESDDTLKTKLRIIPFKGANGSGGILTGIKPDGFFLGDEEKAVIIAPDSAIFGDGKEYDAILNL